ncbi:hypothetical protein E4U21_006273 [Claviceps maximensis]|nr:hypothetical protein E4U21_006273 [Claviceps maximensis]
MPFVVTDDNYQSIRKRRRDDDDINHRRHHRQCHPHSNRYRIYEPDKHQDHYLLNQAQELLSARRVLPLSAKCKRARISSSSSSYEDDGTNIHSFSRDTSLPSPLPSPLPPQSQQQHRRRASQILDGSFATKTTPSRPIAAVLAPCYICHRRPGKKADLDSFAQCQGCGERACFVCVRQCHGWNPDDGMSVLSEQEVLTRSFRMDDSVDEGAVTDSDGSAHKQEEARQRQRKQNRRHDGSGERDGNHDIRLCDRGWAASGHRSVVCSRCCVERGAEGEVICLGCLSGMPGA